TKEVKLSLIGGVDFPLNIPAMPKNVFVPFKIEKTLQPPAKPNPPQTDKPIYKPDDLITISWKEVEEATSYNLYILDEQGNIIKKIENISETRFAQKGNQLGLEEGKRYQVSVSGVNAAGEGPRSEPSSVFSIETTPRPPVRPKKPNTDKSSYRPDEPIKISWEAVEGAVSYNIYIYAQEDGKEIKKLMGIQGQELVKTAQELGLEPGNYYLQISAVNEAGESELSEKSENFSIVPSGVPPSQPPPVSATPTSISIQLSPDGTQATITWQWDGDPNAEFELQIAFKGENIETGEIIKVKGVNFYTFTNLASGSYKVRLRAKEPSSWTEVVGFTISAPPPVTAPEAPRGLRVEASADNVVISWEEVADANAGYEVEIRDDRDNLVHSHQTAKSSEVTAYKFNPQNVDGQGKKLAPGNYKVRIKAIKEERGERSESPWSNYVDFNIPAPPQPPTQPPPSRQSIQERFQISVRDGTEALLEEIIASEIEDLRFWLEKKYSPEKYEIEISVRPPEVPFTPDAEYIENLYYTLETLPQSLRDKLKGLTIWVYGSPIYFDYTVINKNTGKTVEKDTNALMGKKGELISPQGSYPASPYGVVLFYSEKARQQMKTEGWRNPPPFRAVLFHELSHVLYHTFLTTQQRIEFESYYRNSGTNPQNFVSTYAMTSVREDFAETMAAYFTNSINLIAQAKSSP
ncbi:MAG: fibronectin type III domain-containing protein, partial [Candidatus Omnitrophota bacterium]